MHWGLTYNKMLMADELAEEYGMFIRKTGAQLRTVPVLS
jgi:hypothetical protein